MKILVINNVHIGDVIMSTAALKMLHQAYPCSKISLMTNPACGSLLLDGTVITEILPDSFVGKGLSGRLYWIRTLWRIVTGRFDAVFFFGHPSGRIMKLCKLARIPFRVAASHSLTGRPNRSARRHATHVIPMIARGTTHVVDYYQDIVQGLHPRLGRHYPLVGVDAWVQPNNDKALVAVCFTGSPDNRHRLPDEYVCRIIRLLDQADIAVISPLSVADFQNMQDFYRKHRLPAQVVCTPTLLDCADKLRSADLLLSIDTSLVHLAAAMDMPVISISGPDASQTFPCSARAVSLSVARSCKKCGLEGCLTKSPPAGYIRPCIEKITPEIVVQVVKTMLNQAYPNQDILLVDQITTCDG